MSKQVMYIHKDGKSLTKCPNGGASLNGVDYVLGAHVGSLACGECINNKGTYHNYVVCNRKERKNETA